MKSIFSFFFRKRITLVEEKQESVWVKRLSNKKIKIIDGPQVYINEEFFIAKVEYDNGELSISGKKLSEDFLINKLILLSNPITMSEKGHLCAMGILGNNNGKCCGYIQLEIFP